MDNPKFISDDAAGRATITVTPMVAGMSVAAMQNDVYAHVCRATGTVMTIVLTWPTAEMVGGVHEAWSNLSPSGTHQVLGFADEAGANKVLDTGIVLACPWPARKLRGKRWTPAKAASAYAFGGGSHGRVWFNNTLVRRLEIRLSDPANLQGYIEVARLYVGQSWSPAVGADYNPLLTPGGTGTAFRDGSGGRRTTRGTKFNSMSFALSCFEEPDRMQFMDMAAGNGIEGPLIASLYPNDANPGRERDHQMFCAFATPPGVRRPNFRYHATNLELESI
jgi:hypothetical protein